MHRAAVLLLAAACGSGFGGGTSLPPGNPTPGGEAQVWLDSQNGVRRNAQPTPLPPLPPLTWSTSAAAVAQAWADGCTYQHNAGRGDRGENIAASAPQGLWGAGDAVAAWASEAKDYDYTNNTCAPGAQCGHYTQLVWRNTVRVGCAHRACSTGSPFAQNPSWDFWVCDYEPPGNWVGQRPY